MIDVITAQTQFFPDPYINELLIGFESVNRPNVPEFAHYNELRSANVQSICEGMVFEFLLLHFCFVVEYCFSAET